MKIWLIARRLMYQHRWLYLILILFPFGMALVLLLPAAKPDAGDVIAILREECLYGLALVGFTPPSMLVNEQRSRRIVMVLSRAVSRYDYLLALLCAAWVPLVLYTAAVMLAGLPLFAGGGHAATRLWGTALTEAALGLCIASASIFFACWLPSLVASTVSVALAGAIVFSGHTLPRLGWLGLLLALAAAWAFFAAATAIFERRDLKLITE